MEWGRERGLVSGGKFNVLITHISLGSIQVVIGTNSKFNWLRRSVFDLVDVTRLSKG
jgi:hypothetical protein